MELKLLKDFNINITKFLRLASYIYLQDDSIINELDIDKDIPEEEFLNFIKLNFCNLLCNLRINNFKFMEVHNHGND